MKSFIAVEGLDGCGKTTLTKMLANELKGLYLSTPPAVLKANGLRKKVDAEGSVQTRLFYYLLGNLLVSDEIKRMREFFPVVCDRYIHSTLSSFSTMVQAIGLDTNALGLEKPDITFFLLMSDEEERIERIRVRGRRTLNDVKQEDLDFRRQYLDYYQRNSAEFTFVDTSHETPAESLRKMKDELSRRGLLVPMILNT